MSLYSDQVISDGAIGYWRLNAASGTTETDRGSGGNNATISGGVTLNQLGAVADGDRAQLFDGSSGRVLMPVGVNPWSGDFTIEAWANPLTVGLAEQGVLDKEVAATNGWRLGLATTKWQFWTTESGGGISIATATNSVAPSVWAHLAVTRVGSLFSFYLNGVLVGSSSLTYVAPLGGFEVGGLGMGWSFNGRIDEVAVYSAGLTAAQLLRHYFIGTNPSQKEVNAKLHTYLKNTLSATSNDLTTNIQQKIAAVSVTGSDRRTPQLKAMIVSAGISN